MNKTEKVEPAKHIGDQEKLNRARTRTKTRMRKTETVFVFAWFQCMRVQKVLLMLTLLWTGLQ